ncbi:MAG: hypothetical protein SCH66_00975 [Methanolobus sp.]|nr:hypothetical protein [Methanolobus sp.]
MQENFDLSLRALLLIAMDLKEPGILTWDNLILIETPNAGMDSIYIPGPLLTNSGAEVLSS